MVTVLQVEQHALRLPEKQRAKLAARILDSLPPCLSEVDEGLAEAIKRDAELDSNPKLAISLTEFERQIRLRHPRG